MSLPKFNLSRLRESVLRQQSATRKDISNLLLLDRLQSQMRREETEKTEENKINENEIPYGVILIVLKIKKPLNGEEYEVLTLNRVEKHSYESPDQYGDLLTNITESVCCIDVTKGGFTDIIDSGDTNANDVFDFINEMDFKTPYDSIEDAINDTVEIYFLSDRTIFTYLEGGGHDKYEGKPNQLKKDVIDFLTTVIKKSFGRSKKDNQPCISGIALESVEVYMGTKE